ncbi:MAG TPA: hypothetical protein VH590_12250 [Ktedonobacterales bacterium]
MARPHALVRTNYAAGPAALPLQYSTAAWWVASAESANLGN